MIKVVLFDADGVLITGEKFSMHLEREYGISKDVTAEFFTQILPECVVGKIDLKEVLPPFLLEWGWKGSVDEFLSYWHTSEHTINNELVTYIQNLRKKGITCALATNQTKYRAEYMLKEMGFEHVFDKVYTSAHLGVKKPETEFYKKVITDLQIDDKKEVLFWDDSEENIAGAKHFGINAEFYTSFQDFIKKMNDIYHISF